MTLSPEHAAFYLDRLRADSARLAEVARLGLTADVPPCPGWTVESVVRHTATVYLHKIEILRLGRLPDPWPPELDTREPLALYDEARAAILKALDQAGTALETWTFSPSDKTSGFWYRRMALETVVHRVDAELAHQVVTPIDRDLALDGIDEVLTLMLGGPWWSEGDTSSPVDATVRVTADGNAWTIKADATTATVTRDTEADVAAEIYGDPADILLWLWGRQDNSAVQTSGSPEAVSAFRARVAECTT